MEPRYTITAKLTDGDVLALQKLSCRRAQRRYLLLSLILPALYYGMSVAYGIAPWELAWWEHALFLAMFGFYLLWCVALLPKRVARAAKKLRNPNAGDNTFAFFDDEMTVEDAIEKVQMRYTGLLAVVETDEIICFLPSKARAFLLPKRDCDDPAGLMAFIAPKLSAPVRRDFPKV